MKPWKKKPKKSLTAVDPFKIDWWQGTNDPKTWSPYVSIPKSTAAAMVDAQAAWGPAHLDTISKEQWLAYKKMLTQKMLYGSGAYAQGSALSASAVSNYTQVYLAYYKEPMTYEKAVALNNGD